MQGTWPDLPADAEILDAAMEAVAAAIFSGTDFVFGYDFIHLLESGQASATSPLAGVLPVSIKNLSGFISVSIETQKKRGAKAPRSILTDVKAGR